MCKKSKIDRNEACWYQILMSSSDICCYNEIWDGGSEGALHQCILVGVVPD